MGKVIRVIFRRVLKSILLSEKGEWNFIMWIRVVSWINVERGYLDEE